MWNYSMLLLTLLMAVSGLGMFAIGIRKKEMIEAGIGCCFIGNALFGYLARSNDAYAWLQAAFVIGMISLIVVKSRTLKRHEKPGAGE